MARITVQKAPQSTDSGEDSLKELVALFCYHFQQYTFNEALDLPLKTLQRMLKTARKEKAKEYLELAQIARVAQSAKPAPYNKLTSRYESEANG